MPKGQGQNRDQGCTEFFLFYLLTHFIAGYSQYVPKEDKYVPKEEKYIPKEEKYVPKEDKQKRDNYSSQSCKTHHFSRYP